MEKQLEKARAWLADQGDEQSLCLFAEYYPIVWGLNETQTPQTSIYLLVAGFFDAGFFDAAFFDAAFFDAAFFIVPS